MVGAVLIEIRLSMFVIFEALYCAPLITPLRVKLMQLQQRKLTRNVTMSDNETDLRIPLSIDDKKSNTSTHPTEQSDNDETKIQNRLRLSKLGSILIMSVVILIIIIIIIISITINGQSDNVTEHDRDNGHKSCIKSKPYDPSNILCIQYPCIYKYQSYINSIFNESKSWNKQTSTEYLKTFHQTNLGKCIINVNISCQLRPLPDCYLPQNVIQYHLSTFYESGASSISSTKWAAMTNFTKIGRTPNNYDKNGIQWVSPYNAQTELLKNCSKLSGYHRQNANCALSALGIEINDKDMFEDDWGHPTKINRVMQVDVYNKSLKELNLRIPSGNEQGTDALWRPGGYTINGSMEAVVDIISKAQYCWNAVAAPNGSFCYDSCELVCDDFKGCDENNCQYINSQ